MEKKKRGILSLIGVQTESRGEYKDGNNKELNLKQQIISVPVSYTHLRAHET